LFQIGDLVQYNIQNKWHGVRKTNPKKEIVGVITEIVQSGNGPTIHVHWNNGDKNIYLEEELKSPNQNGN
jgi:predicted DNA-binding protein with PD1-like motif